ncbi:MULTISPECIES: hypothetical protein [Clostridium]|uniref:hypothetical protein n=2 Tax=Clostridium TaxID=1485 RepID=UPI0010BDA986|nr:MULTISPECIES: hypothetical protein [Clostridium]MDU6543802.1 hypothetical protein [Clostridium sp.]MBA8968056.1 hypothetical protein [Clostridium butyricum]MBA8970889.1 hypothetical protein [Clostridium butyricum]MBC2429249.1 hypothetical protein [Clostridium butyricum]MDU5101991.1 hypothetical protein [Clostridium butyricum]
MKNMWGEFCEEHHPVGKGYTENMEESKKHIIEAVRALRKIKCECDNTTTCDRCVVILKLNSIHNFFSQD